MGVEHLIGRGLIVKSPETYGVRVKMDGLKRQIFLCASGGLDPCFWESVNPVIFPPPPHHQRTTTTCVKFTFSEKNLGNTLAISPLQTLS